VLESDCTPDDCTAIVLAGGLGRRMGGPKALLSFAGSPLLQCVLATTTQVAARTIVVTAAGLPVDLSIAPDVTTVTDLHPEQGPLMGLYTGLCASSTSQNIVVGCDMPFLSPTVLQYLGSLADGHDAVVPVLAGKPQYLHAVYSKECIPAAERLLERGSLKLGLLTDQVRTRYVQPGEWEDIDPDGRSMMNLNSPEDLERAEAMCAGGAPVAASLRHSVPGISTGVAKT
jgi:molybdopterin-guanine dinucleotide biosynthesis protein A